jgi:hypothetical protein
MNPADVGTKRLPAPRMRSLMSTLGMYNVQTGSLEGADDPAGIFKKKGNVVGQIAAILSVLSLHQVQGCQTDSNNNDGDLSLNLVVFSLMLGFAVLVFCRLLGFLQRQHFDRAEPDAEPAIGRTDPTWKMWKSPIQLSMKLQPHPVPFLMMPRISSPLPSQQVQLTCQHQKGFFVG